MFALVQDARPEVISPIGFHLDAGQRYLLANPARSRLPIRAKVMLARLDRGHALALRESQATVAQDFDPMTREKCDFPLIDGIDVRREQNQAPHPERLETRDDAISGADGGYGAGLADARSNIFRHSLIKSRHGRTIEADQVDPRVGEQRGAFFDLGCHGEEFLPAAARQFQAGRMQRDSRWQHGGDLRLSHGIAGRQQHAQP